LFCDALPGSENFEMSDVLKILKLEKFHKTGFWKLWMWFMFLFVCSLFVNAVIREALLTLSYRVMQNKLDYSNFQPSLWKLHKITTLTPIVYEQVKYKFLYSSVINILCDVISDIVGNMKTRQLTSASSCARICGTRKVATELPRLKPSRLFHLGEHSNSLFTVVVVFETLSTRKKSCKPAGSRLVKTLSIAL